MASLLNSTRVAALASSAVWASLGAALVIHGCAPATNRPDPSVRRAPPPAPPREVAAAPLSPPVPVPPPAPPEPPKPVFAERPSLPYGEPEVRMRIAALRSSTPVVRLGNPSGTLVMHAGALPAREVRAPVAVRQSSTGWTVTEGTGRGARTLEVRSAAPIEFHPPAGKAGTVSFDGHDCPGPVRIVPVDDAPGALDLVVDIAMERYLPGVLEKEMYKGWKPEAYRAQAIAARSFAICEHAQWSAVRHYDVVAGEASQAWSGESTDAAKRDAVRATRGMVLAFDGRVVPAYYSSCCGGVPANACDSLTRNPFHGIAPLAAGGQPRPRATCCTASKRYDWSQAMSAAGICAQLRAWSADQVAARAERLERTTPEGPLAGRVPAPAQGSTGAGSAVQAIASAEPPAPARGARTLDPAMAEIADDAPLELLASIQGIRSVEVVGSNAAGRATRVRLVDASGRALEMRAEDFRRAVNYARPGASRPKESLPSSNLRSARVDGARIEFTGHGFGHGVGMCQFGAQSAAERGEGFPQILARYYPGATVVKAY